MKKVQIQQAQASFSALVTAAERGQPTLISRQGKPCAMIVPVSEGARLYPLDMLNLASHLVALPEPLETGRDKRPLRGIDFE
jgi:hypothetical protein